MAGEPASDPLGVHVCRDDGVEEWIQRGPLQRSHTRTWIANTRRRVLSGGPADSDPPAPATVADLRGARYTLV
jgi:hypothetical protein